MTPSNMILPFTDWDKKKCFKCVKATFITVLNKYYNFMIKIVYNLHILINCTNRTAVTVFTYQI